MPGRLSARSRQSPIQFRSAAADRIEFEDAGREDDLLLPGEAWVYLCGKDGLRDSVRFLQDTPIGVYDLAAPDESRALLDADAVAGGQGDAVLPGARAGQKLRRALGAFRPVGGDDNHVGAVERQRARRFGKAHVVADEDADAREGQRDDRQSVTARDEAVNAQHRQMALAVVGDEAVRSGYKGAVVED